MNFDFKKEYKEFYQPTTKPSIVNVPAMKFIAVRGKGDPNDVDGDYAKALNVLYTIAYTLKMSYLGEYKIDGYFKYVVPPLEGFWYQKDIDGFDYTKKDLFVWTSVIRVPDFIKKSDFEWAIEEAKRKKKLDCSNAEFITIEEGLCVQIMHLGAYDDEPTSVELMNKYMTEQGYQTDFNCNRMHHEIYLSDPRKTEVAKNKTIIRLPIKHR